MPRRIIKKADLAWRVIEGQAFIINTRTSTLHELDETGTMIWKLLMKDRDIPEIAAELSSYFDVSKEQAAKDTKDFFKELEHKGIIE